MGKGSNREVVDVRKCVKLCMLIALQPPRRRARCAASAYVSWDTIEEIRDALREDGVPIDEELTRIEREQRGW